MSAQSIWVHVGEAPIVSPLFVDFKSEPPGGFVKAERWAAAQKYLTQQDWGEVL